MINRVERTATVRSTVMNEQPLFVQPVVKLGCTSGLTTGCIHDTAGCQTGLTTGWMFVTGLTTGCIVYTNIYPVVKPVWQPVWQQDVLCKRDLKWRQATYWKMKNDQLDNQTKRNNTADASIWEASDVT